MARPAPRTLEVISTATVTRNMARVTLGGAGLEGFPEGTAGGYVKLRLSEGGPDNPMGEKPIVRTYTIRAQRAGEIDLDFAVHGVDHGIPGPAVQFALNAKPGQALTVAGPGPAKPLPEGMDHYLIAGDMTALPAISVNLEALPADARGDAVIEIQHEDDKQDIAKPDGVTIHWLVNPVPGSQPDLLANALRELGWPDGDVYCWCASEFSAMRALRTYLREERGLGADRLYISSYWKQGENEDDHRVSKQGDLQAAG